MDRVDAGFPGDADDVRNIEVGGDRLLTLADQVALVGLEPVQRETILVSVDRHGANAHFGRRTHHADTDFATVGNEELLDGHIRAGSRD